ncbi:hypothetical protein [Planctellipticum variicoloris]|uniref:hypothetical protein n=1 Tax=Planctellipticum variicoloris TaxID=3064265 RepID=UPI00301343AD|nr:hypothetical protein SH412_004593 [Planctomycetaceae bacterium SH412]
MCSLTGRLSLSNHLLLSQQWFKANEIFLAQFAVESIACTECGAVTTRLTESSRKYLASRLKWQRIEAERKPQREPSAEH